MHEPGIRRFFRVWFSWETSSDGGVYFSGRVLVDNEFVQTAADPFWAYRDNLAALLKREYILGILFFVDPEASASAVFFELAQFMLVPFGFEAIYLIRVVAIQIIFNGSQDNRNYQFTLRVFLLAHYCSS
jgi:hypothetical protein